MQTKDYNLIFNNKELSIFKHNILTILFDRFKNYSNNSNINSIKLIDLGCIINDKNKLVSLHNIVINEHYIFVVTDMSIVTML